MKKKNAIVCEVSNVRIFFSNLTSQGLSGRQKVLRSIQAKVCKTKEGRLLRTLNKIFKKLINLIDLLF